MRYASIKSAQTHDSYFSFIVKKSINTSMAINTLLSQTV